jgi:hypothetical protein
MIESVYENEQSIWHPTLFTAEEIRALTAGLDAAEKSQISFLCWVSDPDFCVVQHVS